MPKPQLLTEVERRIALRLLSYWEKQRGERPMPSPQDIRAQDIEDLWDFCFVLRLPDNEGPTYHHQGAQLQPICGDLPSSEKIDALFPASHAAILHVGCQHLKRSGKPVVNEGVFKSPGGQMVKYRQCLLPLGEGENVTGVFGGMGFRVLGS